VYTLQPDKPLNPVILAMLKAQHAIAAAHDTSYLVIGAAARDILMTHVFGIDATRATRDVDFAVALEDWDQFTRIKQTFIDTGEFEPVPHQAHRLLYKASKYGAAYPLDLIPFGVIARGGNEIAWPPDMDVVMNVAGYAEAMQTAVQVDLGGGFAVSVVSLPALAALKLLAWHERGVRDNKNAQDLFFLLKNYERAGNLDRLYEQAGSLLEACAHDTTLAGAALLGYDTKLILADDTREQLMDILSDAAKRDRLVLHMDRSARSDSARTSSYLDQFERGLRLTGL
jgi:predicted nucleotidyltransferase